MVVPPLAIVTSLALINPFHLERPFLRRAHLLAVVVDSVPIFILPVVPVCAPFLVFDVVQFDVVWFWRRFSFHPFLIGDCGFGRNWYRLLFLFLFLLWRRMRRRRLWL
jgi:hypothetical protein